MKSLLFLSLLSVVTINAQNQQKPCSAPESSQFDFWIGEWECTWVDAKGGKHKGTNSIRKILDSCVIEENFDGNPGTQLVGKSHSVYSTQQEKWFQTWVDNSGGYLDFEGDMIDNKMILSRTVNLEDGASFIQRMVWYNITENKFDWNWERSDDNGETWTTNWKLHYRRK